MQQPASIYPPESHIKLPKTSLAAQPGCHWCHYRAWELHDLWNWNISSFYYRRNGEQHSMNIGLELWGLPSRPTWEMYRMEHARQYKKTYLTVEVCIGSVLTIRFDYDSPGNDSIQFDYTMHCDASHCSILLQGLKLTFFYLALVLTV